jgi:uncharacterized protein (DUF2141 family)
MSILITPYLFLLTLIHSSVSVPSDMKIEISGIQNAKGHILIAVFNQADGFPDESSKAFRKERIPAKSGSISYVLTGLPAGKYAIGIVHDENDNMKLDTGLFGIPKEGFCFSNAAMGTFGPPSFDAAAILHPSKNQPHKLLVKYW